MKFHENPSSGNRVVPRRQREGHGEANSRFSQCCKRAYKRETTVACNYCKHRYKQPYTFASNLLAAILNIS